MRGSRFGMRDMGCGIRDTGYGIRDAGSEELSADQVAAEDKEEIDADPAEAMDAPGKRETHNARVINDHDDDGERAEKIEAGLALAIAKARVDFGGWRDA